MSGGGDGQSTKFDPPDWTKDLYPQAMQQAMQLAQTPYQQYQGMTVADVNPWQHGAAQLIVDKALYGDPQSNAARGSLMNISQGGAQNPFMQNQYTEQMIGNNAQNMADAFATGTAANTDAMAARSGAFGGSAHQQQAASNAGALAKQVGDMATSTRQAEINRKGSLWNQDVSNVMQAASMAPAFSQMDHQDFAAMAGQGDKFRNIEQEGLNASQQAFEQQKNYPYQQFDWLMSKLGQGSGQYGQDYQSGGGQSGLMNGLGAGMGLYGLLGG